LYFATLPFGVGILYFPVYLVGLWRFGRRASLVFVASVAAPFIGFTVYWGASIYMLREGLQFVVVISLLAAFLGHSVLCRRASANFDHLVRLAATARVGEVLFMLLVPTIVTTGVLGPAVWRATDIVALVTMVTAVGCLGWLTWSWLTSDELAAERAGRTAAGRARQ
jgi:hypothetical protein